MLNSQRINNDPEPWKCIDRGQRAPIEVLCGHCEYDPRHEYDNNPNPILIAYREEGASLFGGTQGWIELALHGTHCRNAPVNAEHFDHAHKVLTRLVNIFGTEE